MEVPLRRHQAGLQHLSLLSTVDSRRIKAGGSSGLPPLSRALHLEPPKGAPWIIPVRKGEGLGRNEQPKTPDYEPEVEPSKDMSKDQYVSPTPKVLPVREPS